jgi:hypothetical protein
MVAPKVPRLKGQRKAQRAPVLRLPRVTGSPAAGGKHAPATLQIKDPSLLDIGEGPWFFKGKKASSAEYRCIKVLQELGWDPDFQVSKFGGRTYPGGQVLDILVTQRQPLVYIDVRGYYHKGAQGEANDARKIFQLRASAPDVKLVVVWEEEAKHHELLRNKLMHEVGARR